MSQPIGTPGRPAAPARRRGAGTASDMVRSLVVIGVLVAIVFLALPRPRGRIEQPVDVAASVRDAQAAGLPALEPVVPEGWRANAATFEPDVVEGLPTWSVGYLLPDDSFAGVRTTAGATPAWLDGVTSAGEADGEREVAGQVWQELASGTGTRRRSLVLVTDQVTTVVTGTADDDELDELAAAVVPS